MIQAVELTSDVVAGGTALGGLLLVYVGATATSFGSYERGEKNAVRGRHQVKAWFGTLGVICALLASGLAILGKWLEVSCLSAAGVVILMVALAWAAIVAVLSAKEVA